jgi:hypothetical protein
MVELVLSDLGQLFKWAFLFLIKFGRNHDIDRDQQIPSSAAAQAGNAFAAQAEGRAALGPFGYFELLFAFERWNAGFRA